MRHWGDLGNLKAVRGVASYRNVDSVITVFGILGRGITVHAGPDRGRKAQPTGDAGARIAVCVIGVANPDTLADPSIHAMQ